MSFWGQFVKTYSFILHLKRHRWSYKSMQNFALFFEAFKGFHGFRIEMMFFSSFALWRFPHFDGNEYVNDILIVKTYFKLFVFKLPWPSNVCSNVFWTPGIIGLKCIKWKKSWVQKFFAALSIASFSERMILSIFWDISNWFCKNDWT